MSKGGGTQIGSQNEFFEKTICKNCGHERRSHGKNGCNVVGCYCTGFM